MSGGAGTEVMQVVRRFALEVVDLPPRNRDDWYKGVRQFGRDAALCLGMTDIEADEAAAEMEQFIRAMASELETNGGTIAGGD